MADVARIVLRTLAALLLTLVATIAVPSSMACACSCAQVSTDEAMANSTAVFDGVVVTHSQPVGGLAGGYEAVSAERGLEAVFVTSDRRVVATDGCAGVLTLL